MSTTRISGQLSAVSVMALCTAMTLTACSNAPPATSGTTQDQANTSTTAESPAPETTTKETVVGLPFTIDDFTKKVSGLKPMESLGEFKQSNKFSFDFADGTGTVTGEFLKANHKLDHIQIVGTGSTWSDAVKAAVSLSSPDGSKADNVLSQLGITDGNLTEGTVSAGGISYETGALMDQQRFFMKNESDPDATPAELTANYVTPTIGVSLSAFRKGFNSRLAAISPRLKIKGPGSDTTSDALYSYQFTDDTILSVNTNDKKQIESIELDSVPKDASKFWPCADAAITALNPHISQGTRQSILNRLGTGSKNTLPKENNDFDEGALHYSYNVTNGCALMIQSNKE